MKHLLDYKNILAIAVLLAIVGIYSVLSQQPREAIGSIRSGDEYLATSTAAIANSYGSTVTSTRTIKRGYGALGSVVITGANTGVFNLYDATTTSLTGRAPSMATSTILIASFPASTAAGTYTFDVVFSNGLLIEVESGLMATSTITFR